MKSGRWRNGSLPGRTQTEFDVAVTLTLHYAFLDKAEPAIGLTAVLLRRIGVAHDVIRADIIDERIEQLAHPSDDPELLTPSLSQRRALEKVATATSVPPGISASPFPVLRSTKSP